mgnify:CR=1 FL=1
MLLWPSVVKFISAACDNSFIKNPNFNFLSLIILYHIFVKFLAECIKQNTSRKYCIPSSSPLSLTLIFVSCRSAEVTTCLAKLDCFLDDVTGAEANLRHTNTTLTSDILLSSTLPHPAVSTPVVSGKSEIGKPARKDLDRVKSSDVFGFESEDSGDESFSIKQALSSADR